MFWNVERMPGISRILKCGDLLAEMSGGEGKTTETHNFQRVTKIYSREKLLNEPIPPTSYTREAVSEGSTPPG